VPAFCWLPGRCALRACLLAVQAYADLLRSAAWELALAPQSRPLLICSSLFVILNQIAMLVCAHAGVLRWPAPDVTADFGAFRTEYVDAFASRLALVVALSCRILYNFVRSPENCINMEVSLQRTMLTPEELASARAAVAAAPPVRFQDSRLTTRLQQSLSGKDVSNGIRRSLISRLITFRVHPATTTATTVAAPARSSGAAAAARSGGSFAPAARPLAAAVPPQRPTSTTTTIKRSSRPPSAVLAATVTQLCAELYSSRDDHDDDDEDGNTGDTTLGGGRGGSVAAPSPTPRRDGELEACAALLEELAARLSVLRHDDVKQARPQEPPSSAATARRPGGGEGSADSSGLKPPPPPPS
jgi:hypothetical protein